MAHAEERDRDAFYRWLNAPPQGKDPDAVSQAVIDDEMSLFQQARRQNG